LLLADEYAVIVGAGEVLFALNDAVVLADGFVEHHADPFAGGELGGADKGHRADGISLAGNLDSMTHFHRRTAA